MIKGDLQVNFSFLEIPAKVAVLPSSLGFLHKSVVFVVVSDYSTLLTAVQITRYPEDNFIEVCDNQEFCFSF